MTEPVEARDLTAAREWLTANWTEPLDGRRFLAWVRANELAAKHIRAALRADTARVPEGLRAVAEAVRDQCREAFAADGIAKAEKVWPKGPAAVFAAWDRLDAALATSPERSEETT